MKTNMELDVSNAQIFKLNELAKWMNASVKGIADGIAQMGFDEALARVYERKRLEIARKEPQPINWAAGKGLHDGK